MSAQDRPVVSAAICSRDRSASLLRCLLSIVDQAWPAARLELVVVDDASRDDTRAAVEGLFRRIEGRGFRRLHVETSPRARGAAGARARALEACSPESQWILHIDDDAILGPAALARMAAAGEAQDVGIVGPRLVYLSRPDLLCQGANYMGAWTGRLSCVDAKEPVDCDWVNGTCLLLRSEASRRLGPLYDGYYANYEDVELSLAVRKLGYRVRYEPRALVYHDAPVGLRPEGREYYLYRNKAIVIRRHLAGLRRLSSLSFHLSLGLAKACWDAWRAGKLASLSPVIFAAFRDALLDKRGKTWPPEAA